MIRNGFDLKANHAFGNMGNMVMFHHNRVDSFKLTHLDVLSTATTTGALVICECSVVICSVVIIIPFQVEKEILIYLRRLGP